MQKLKERFITSALLHGRIMSLQIRSFTTSDADCLRSICCKTAAEMPFLPYLDEPRFACELYLDRYLELESESCFVALLQGNIVGYIVGTIDAKAFRQREHQLAHRRLLRLLQIQVDGTLRRRLRHAGSHYALAKMYWNLLSGSDSGSERYFDVTRYPAQSHVQVAPDARGKCVALALMLKFHEYLKARGVRGHHGCTVEEAGRESFSRMLLALKFQVIHERQFSARDVKALRHPGTWKERVLVRDL